MLRGWGHAELMEANGGLNTSLQGVTGEADFLARTAQGGSGYGVDLGLAARHPNGWRFSVTLDNVVSRISWSQKVELHRETVRADTIRLSDTNKDEDDLVESDSETTSGASFTEGLPSELNLAADRAWGPLLLAANLSQGFSDRFGTSTSPRLLVRGGYQP